MTPARSEFALVVGLGNPGSRYLHTRHNAGFHYLDALACALGWNWRAMPRFKAELAHGSHAGRELRLLKPMTFMNRSGEAVGAVLRYFKLSPEALLVAHDELDLPPGIVRLKHGGGIAGHNGLRDIKAHLNNAEFWRLRIGIGHPGSSDQVLHYVLARADAVQQRAIDQALDGVIAANDLVLGGQLERAMHALHSKPEA